ncbi:MAG TPA: c-type cytochrome [Trueperaceae bacterium]|nr:c-type cytochrome [Trueperaceae bacterium]
MNEKQHSVIERWERRWLGLASSMSLIFVLLIATNLAFDSNNVVQLRQRANPSEILASDIFANPGVIETAPNKYRVAVVAQTFSFNPSEILLPVDSEIEFYVTSKDVLHGFQIRSTNTNMEVIPGEVAYSSYTFKKPGEYWVVCNEYCGISHQNMLGKITVVSKAVYAQELANPKVEEVSLGQSVFESNCASCHQVSGQGIPGAFPALKGNVSATSKLAGGKDYLIHAALYGLQGGIKVDGNSFNGTMPAWKQLSDEEISAVLNYAISGWGDDGVADISPEDIAAARSQELSSEDVLGLRQSLGLE